MPSSADNIQETSDRHSTLRRCLGAFTILYWGIIFLATHAPAPDIPIEIVHSDKIIHFGAYFVLAMLTTVWIQLSHRGSVPQLLLLCGVLLLYGALDEWTQQFVNRYTDAGDWLADALGAASGITLIGLAWSRIMGRRGESK